MKEAVKHTIIQKLEEFLKQHGMKAQQFARHSGISNSYISRIRAGKLTIKAGKNEVQIADKYFERIAQVIGYELRKQYWQTRPTSQMKRILATLQDAREFGYTNLIIGETGCGKTYIARKFALQHPVDCYIITIGRTDTVTDVLDKIMHRLRISSRRQSKSSKLNAIINHMRDMKENGMKPTLIFDESEYMTPIVLSAMKELYDNLIGMCALVLIGTDQLTYKIDKLVKRNKDGIPQLWRRVKFGVRELPLIDRRFTDFVGDLEPGLQKFLRSNCDNYGELHDVLVPAMREAERTGDELTEGFVRKVLSI